MVKIIVASQVSRQKDKADFVCDGVDDQIEIQAAIDALPSSGGIVKLLEGRYNISMPIKLSGGCKLVGEDEKSVLRLADAPHSLLAADAHKGDSSLAVTDASGFQSGMPIVIINPEYATGMNITSVNGNVLLLDADLETDFTARHKTGIWAQPHLIMVDGVNDVTIKNLAIDGNRTKQIIIDNKNYKIIKGSSHGIENSVIHICNGARNITINNCHIYGAQAEAILARQAGQNLNFINNKLEDIGDKGICTCGGVPGPGIISGNCITGTGKSANIVPVTVRWGWGDCINLHPSSGKGWIVTNNILRDALRSGIRATGVSGSVISNNYINGCGDSGITTTARDENIITGNSVLKNGTGITIAFPGAAVGCSAVTENIVSENKLHGIMFCGVQYGIIQGNTVSKNGGYGILITDKAYDIPVEEEKWPENPVSGHGLSSKIIVAKNIVMRDPRTR
ncbi:MAG: right-handed parallel beta-helix repeat-containing protein, partial [Victivallaceae bacterium]|nr:right-handed parallel beta-helix repeat-containing protein [Victivallaceae bacterium]